MKQPFWRWLRERIIGLALSYPFLIAGLMFLFLLTVSNHVFFAVGIAIQVSVFWQMLAIGSVMASFGAALLYEVIRLQSRLTEAWLVRSVVATLQHEINNPLQVINLTAEMLLSSRSYDETSLRNILAEGMRIRDAVAKLSTLTQEVRLRREPGFAGLIDVTGSR